MTRDEILEQLGRIAAHPSGAAGLMIDDEIALGAEPIAVGSVSPFALPAEDWESPAVISRLGNEVRIVALKARKPGSGAFKRLLAAIQLAGLSPVVLGPIGPIMPRLMRKWKWRKRISGTGMNRVEEWRP